MSQLGVPLSSPAAVGNSDVEASANRKAWFGPISSTGYSGDFVFQIKKPELGQAEGFSVCEPPPTAVYDPEGINVFMCAIDSLASESCVSFSSGKAAVILG